MIDIIDLISQRPQKDLKFRLTSSRGDGRGFRRSLLVLQHVVALSNLIENLVPLRNLVVDISDFLSTLFNPPLSDVVSILRALLKLVMTLLHIRFGTIQNRLQLIDLNATTTDLGFDLFAFDMDSLQSLVAPNLRETDFFLNPLAAFL